MFANWGAPDSGSPSNNFSEYLTDCLPVARPEIFLEDVLPWRLNRTLRQRNCLIEAGDYLVLSHIGVGVYELVDGTALDGIDDSKVFNPISEYTRIEVGDTHKGPGSASECTQKRLITTVTSHDLNEGIESPAEC